MRTPIPIARSQQVIGMPEHPCETIVRNGALICPYEEMEIRYYEEHAGLYLLTLAGEPFEIFGHGTGRASASLMDGYLPVVQHVAEHQGCKLEQTAFAGLLEGDRVVDGTEQLINFVKLSVTNSTANEKLSLPITFVFGSCFRQPGDRDEQSDKDYWKSFLRRDDIAEDVSPDRPIEPYPYPLTESDGLVTAADKGVVFCLDRHETLNCRFIDEWNEGPWDEGKQFKLGLRVTIDLLPGETKEITYKVPYLPLDASAGSATKLQQMNYNSELQAIKKLWNSLLNRGTQLSVPGTNLENLWKAQTAATFILVDKQNKGSDRLHGGEIYKTWADRYPDKTLNYVHLSPTLYEFVWAQEAAYWVIGMLDMQGYHQEAEDYMEFFFEMQGEGIPGVHDRDILPDKAIAQSYMGTTAHAWLNNTGGVLLAIAEHYKLTNNKQWMIDRQRSILSACNWIRELRKTTKADPDDGGYGLMPAGQSTDGTFASDHLQWYYTDIWSLLGLTEIAKVMKACDMPEAESILAEAEDYRLCFLRSLDNSILDLEHFQERESDYDFSHYIYEGPLHYQKITQWDEDGVPISFKNKIILKQEAERLGLRWFVPMSPQTRIPFNPPYLDNNYGFSLAFLADIIAFNSDAPLFPGAKHSGKQVWEGIMTYCKITELLDIDEKIYSNGLPYNDYLIKKFLVNDENERTVEALNYVLRYGCDQETYMGKETAGLKLNELWFQPCPFTLSMATMRSWIRKMIVFEDLVANRLVVGKAMPKQWIEDAATWESAIRLENAASYYGALSVQYEIHFNCSEMNVRLQLADVARLPDTIEIRLNHPQNAAVKEIVVTGHDHYTLDREKGIVVCQGAIGNQIEIFAKF